MATKTTKPRPFKTLRELANTEGIAPKRLIEAITSGELTAFRFGARDLAIYPDDFEAWKASRKVRPDQERA